MHPSRAKESYTEAAGDNVNFSPHRENCIMASSWRPKKPRAACPRYLGNNLSLSMWGGTQILVVRMALVHDTVHTSKIGKILHVMVTGSPSDNWAPDRAHAAHKACRLDGLPARQEPALCKAFACRLRMQGTSGKRQEREFFSDRQVIMKWHD